MTLFYRLHDPALPFFRLEPQRESTHILVALMEAMWIAPWFAVILPGARAMGTTDLLAYVALNMLAALVIVRVLDSRGMWESLRQIVFLAGLAMAFIWSAGVVFYAPPQVPVLQTVSENLSQIEQITIPAFLPVLILIAFVWWRGLRLALTPPTPTRVAFGMRLGILFFFAVALFQQVRAVTLAAIPLFFFFGLLGISLARALSLRENDGQGVIFGPRWTGFMVGAALAITLLGVLVTALVGGLGPETFAQIIEPILSGVIFLVAFLMTPIFWVAGAIVEAIVNALAQSEMFEELVMPEVGAAIEQGEPQPLTHLEETLQQFWQWFQQLGGIPMCLSVLVVLIVVAAIVFTLRRQRRAAMAVSEEREDLEGDALAGLRDMFRWGRHTLNQALNALNQFGVGRDLFAALTVRRAFAQMVKQAEKAGFPRATSETPYEFRRVLQDAFPAATGAVDTITEAYVRVHYGEVPENSEALQAVIQALDAFKEAVAAR